MTSRARDSGSPAAGIGGLILIVAGLVGSLTFAASLRRLVDEPARYGVNFDVMWDNGSAEVPASVQELLRSHPDVAAVTLYSSSLARVGDSAIALAGMDPVRGVLEPVVLSGRVAAGPDEIALGRITARLLDVGVGDRITLTNDTATADFVITGLVVPPGIGGNDVVGQGSVMTRAGFIRLEPNAPPNAAAVRFRDGISSDVIGNIAVAAGIDVGENFTPTRPSAILNVSRVTFVPYMLAALLAVLAGVTLVNAVYTGVRRRDRQIAVLRALGADGRWLVTAECWQAASTMIVPAVIGVPAGFMVGRYVFRSFADRMGTVDSAAVPVAFVAAALGVLVLLGLASALVGGRRSRRQPSALLLRTG